MIGIDRGHTTSGVRRGTLRARLGGSNQIRQGAAALEAIRRINVLSRIENTGLTTYPDRLYKSAIHSAYEAAKKDPQRLSDFVDDLAFLFKTNSITRGLVNQTDRQVEAVIFAAETLSEAFNRRRETGLKQKGDYKLHLAFRKIASQLNELYVLSHPTSWHCPYKDLFHAVAELLKKEGVKKERPNKSRVQGTLFKLD